MKRRHGVWAPPLMQINPDTAELQQNPDPREKTGIQIVADTAAKRGLLRHELKETAPGRPWRDIRRSGLEREASNSTAKSVGLGKCEAKPLQSKCQQLIQLHERRQLKQTSQCEMVTSRYHCQERHYNLNASTTNGNAKDVEINGSDFSDLHDAQDITQESGRLNITRATEAERLSDSSKVCQIVLESGDQKEHLTSGILDNGAQINQVSDQSKIKFDNFKRNDASNIFHPLELSNNRAVGSQLRNSERQGKGLRLLRLPSIEEHGYDIHGCDRVESEKGGLISTSNGSLCHNLSTITTNADETESQIAVTSDNNITISFDTKQHNCHAISSKSICTHCKERVHDNCRIPPDDDELRKSSESENFISEIERKTIHHFCQPLSSSASFDGLCVTQNVKYVTSIVENKCYKNARSDLSSNQNDGYLENKLNAPNKHIKGSLHNLTNSSKGVCQVHLLNDGLGQEKEFLVPSCKEESASSLSIHYFHQLGEHSQIHSPSPNNFLSKSQVFNKLTAALRAKRVEMEVDIGNFETPNSFQYLVEMEGNSGQLVYCVSPGPSIWDSTGKDCVKKRSRDLVAFRDKLTSASNETISDLGSENSGQHDYSLDSLECTDNGDLENDVKVDKDRSFCLDIDNGPRPMIPKKSNFYIDTFDGLLTQVSEEYPSKTPTDNDRCLCEKITDQSHTGSDCGHSRCDVLDTGSQSDSTGIHQTSNWLKDMEGNAENPTKNTVDIEIDTNKSACFVHRNGFSDPGILDERLELGEASLRPHVTFNDVAESNCDCSCSDVSQSCNPDCKECMDHTYSYASVPMQEKFPKSASSPNLRTNRLKIPRIRTFHRDQNSFIEDDLEVAPSEGALYRCEGSENVHLLSKPHYFSPSLKRKLSSHKHENDLEQLKLMADKLSLTTRRPSYLMWKERLNNESLLKLKSPPENEGKTCAEQEGDDQNEQSRIEAVDYAISWLKRELTEMRAQDQVLAKTLIRLRNDLREVKLQRSCAQHQEILEDAMDLEEEREILGELSCDYIPDPFSPTLKQAGLTKLNIETRRFSVF